VVKAEFQLTPKSAEVFVAEVGRVDLIIKAHKGFDFRDLVRFFVVFCLD
jgi:hypothetical protein